MNGLECERWVATQVVANLILQPNATEKVWYSMLFPYVGKWGIYKEISGGIR